MEKNDFELLCGLQRIIDLKKLAVEALQKLEQAENTVVEI